MTHDPRSGALWQVAVGRPKRPAAAPLDSPVRLRNQLSNFLVNLSFCGFFIGEIMSERKAQDPADCPKRRIAHHQGRQRFGATGGSRADESAGPGQD
jgi:hypothetical protein